MTDETLPTEPEMNGENEDKASPEALAERDGPTVPNPFRRGPEVDRRIRSAVDTMLEDVQNPYETVIVAAQEARRINDRKLKARSIINQALEQVEELVPEVPFVPRPVEDEEPEIKATNEALEKMACGLVDYVVDGDMKTAENYYGEIDFPTDPEEQEEKSEDESAGET
jgi:DNA-directed RNA polymerase subunit K/omega